VAGSKKFRDKLCVYCRDKISITADHVFPREFFQISERDLLPKVPSCKECNNKKSQIEQSAAGVRSFILHC
jgi:5-methylcytosine-specific restriction endonuclease McrA